MKTNNAGIHIIKASEGLRLTSYICPAGVLTIGFGSTGPHVKPDMTITVEQAEELLLQDMVRFENGVHALVSVPLSVNQFSALVSFAYNLGLGALKNSTLLKKLNSGDYMGAANQFPLWVKATVKGKKVTLPGLVKRREAERNLFLSRD